MSQLCLLAGFTPVARCRAGASGIPRPVLTDRMAMSLPLILHPEVLSCWYTQGAAEPALFSLPIAQGSLHFSCGCASLGSCSAARNSGSLSEGPSWLPATLRHMGQFSRAQDVSPGYASLLPHVHIPGPFLFPAVPPPHPVPGKKMQAPLCQRVLQTFMYSWFPCLVYPSLYPASEEHLEVFLLLKGSSKSVVHALVFVVLLFLVIQKLLTFERKSQARVPWVPFSFSCCSIPAAQAKSQNSLTWRVEGPWGEISGRWKNASHSFRVGSHYSCLGDPRSWSFPTAWEVAPMGQELSKRRHGCVWSAP